MNRDTEICCRTTAIGSVWAMSNSAFTLGQIRSFVAAAAALSDDALVSVCGLESEGDDKHYFRRIDAHSATTIADKIVAVTATDTGPSS